MAPNRTAIGSLVLSALALVGLVASESYTDRAIIPVPGDRWTVGFGSTFRDDGTPVRQGDTTTPVAALKRTMKDINKYEGALKQCVKAPLFQHEYDAYVSLAYNIGSGAFCSSSIPTKLNALQYTEACKTILEFTCGPATELTRAKPGEPCYHKTKLKKQYRGLLNRRKAEYAQCMGE